MGIINKILFLLFLCGFGVFMYYVGIPYIQDFNKKTLSQQIALEISANSKKSIPVAFATTTFMIDLAVNPFEKQRGLGGKFFLSDYKGLLFVYNKEEYPAIWMKDMIFSIDIIWLDRNFRIVDIEEKVSPKTYPKSFHPDLPAQYVLEVNAGFVETQNIKIGDQLQLAETDKNNI